MAFTNDELKRAMEPLIAKHGEALIEMVSYRDTVLRLGARESTAAAAMLNVTTLRLIGCALGTIGKTSADFATATVDFEKARATLEIIAGLDD